jgi:phage gp36-like protein
MTYITASAFLDRFDANEIAQRADRGTPRVVKGELLALIAAGGDVSGYPVDTVARAAVALTTVQNAIKDATDMVDSYISARYNMPISPVPSILERIAGDLARYFLFDDRVTDPIKQRYTDAEKLLANVRDGKVQLGADATSNEQPSSSAGAELVSGGRVWGRASGSSFR